ncbi:MAG: hypothetical protein KTR20_06290 [Cellvibrionaceae bacterium]|nr:hypothetical protein [Cellvibrionaceae bacterium]
MRKISRRHFINTTLVGTGASLAIAKAGAANSQKQPPLLGLGSIAYTAEHPGRWAKKVGSHMPQINTTDKPREVRVITPHEMTPEHYIVKHMILDANHHFIAETLFRLDQSPAPISSYVIPEAIDQVIAVSVCNKHDAWLSKPISV